MVAIGLTLATGLRIAARRPAAWAAAATTLACGAALAAVEGPATLPVAVVCGWLIGLAAAGGRPTPLPAVALPAVVRLIPLAWPLLAAMGLVWACGRSAGLVAATMGAAAVATTALRPVFGRAGAVVHETPALPGAARNARAAATQGPWEAEAGRSILARAAMATTLLAMAVCYFLDDAHAGWYPIVASVWFFALALPVVTTSSASGDESARARLIRSAAGPPLGGRAAPLPGTLAFAFRGLVARAALLAWPACVAALLWRGGWERGAGPLAAIGVLAALALAAALTLAAAQLCTAADDTTRAAVACGWALAAAILLPQLPGLPGLPGLLRFAAAITFPVDVEGLRASCETAQVAQLP